jgi:hypothetical protein
MIIQAPKSLSALRLDFAGTAYAAGDRAYPSAGAIPEVRISGPGGIALALDGTLKLSPAGQPIVAAGAGVALEPPATNLLAMSNAAPTSTAGWTLLSNRPTDATITLVDDRAAMDAAGIFAQLLAAGVMNGKAVRFYNPSPDTEFAIPFFGASGAAYAISAYVRCLKGGGYITVTGGGGQTPIFTNGGWQRVGRVHNAGQQARLVVRPQSEVLVILAQVETARITSPIVVSGQPMTRSAAPLLIVGGHLFGRPHTIVLEVEFARQDNAERTMLHLTNGAGEGCTLARTNDNALTGTQTGSFRRPCVPRLTGPGRVRMAHRVSPRGQTIGAAGLLAHAPFMEAATGLDRVAIGARVDGTLPMTGWVRSVEILCEVGDDDLEAIVAGPADAFLPETRRYISPAGSDDSDGLTPATAWRTLAKATDVTLFWPGTHFFLERGAAWSETLLPSTRCTYRPYGSGAAPQVGIGQTYGVDENAANDFRIQGLHITRAKSRGVNCYGASGVMLVGNEISRNGSTTDDNAIGVAIRGNTRKAEAELVAVPNGVQVQAYATTEAALTGIFRVECTTGGSGSATRWRARRPDGSLVNGTASGGVAFSGGGVSFTLSGTASVGDVVQIRSKPFNEIALPANALAEDVLVEGNYIHDNVGKAAGDAVYIEGVGGICIVQGNDIPPPVGVQADCIQCGRNNHLYVRNPAHAIIRQNRVRAFTGGGKGAIVILSETFLIEGNHIRGHNFCVSVNPMGRSVIRGNYCEEADLYPYSWGIGIGSDFDSVGLEIYGNIIVNCRRGVTLSGNGNSTFTMNGRNPGFQNRAAIAVYDNDIRDADAAVFIDRPTSGRIQFNTATNATLLVERRTTALPPGETDLRIGFNRLN